MDVYISYSRRADYSLIPEIIKQSHSNDRFKTLMLTDNPYEEEIKDNNIDNSSLEQWDVIYDANGLKPGHSIDFFMQKLSEASHIIFLLSEGYFQSPFCMTELLATYRKQASRLIPVIVFVGPFDPDNFEINKLLDYWRSQRKNANNEEAESLCKKIIDGLPNAHAWLLGEYDHATDSFSSLFSVVEHHDVAAEASQSVIQALKNSIPPVFKSYSAFEQERSFSEVVVSRLRRLKRTLGKDCFDDFLRRLYECGMDGTVDSIDDISRYLISPHTAEEFMKILDSLESFLEEFRFDLSDKELILLTGFVQDVLGSVLHSVVDKAFLHRLIHTLNRNPDIRELPIRSSPSTAYQLIVAAIFCTGARFKYELNPEDGQYSLSGKYELPVMEGGANERNIVKRLETDITHKKAFYLLGARVGLSKSDLRDFEHMKSALKREFDKNPGYYLCFKQEDVDGYSLHNCRSELARTYPNLPQILSSDNNEAMRQSEIHIAGVDSGKLYHCIHGLYKKIHEITNDSP